LLVARPIWTNSRHLAVLGLCNFRRTWCNNIVLDYLTVHPAIVRRLPKHAKNAPPPIRGVGLALFYFLSTLAVELNVGTIWGEATQNSAVRYQVWFQQPDLNDLIRLTDEDFKNFIRRTETKERP